jgi:hypothetical protein
MEKKMITNQIMKRNFMSSDISQRTKDGFFNATELLKVFNERTNQNKRFKDFWENNNTKEFLLELSQELNGDNSAHLKTHETLRGKGGATWMHPYLFVKLAMWLSPKVELQIIKWVYDNLIEFRLQAGVDYKDMCKSIQDNYLDFFKKKPNPLIFSNEIKFINSLVCGKEIGGIRNALDEKELALLNNLQKLNISLMNSKRYNLKQRRDKLSEFAEMSKILY